MTRASAPQEKPAVRHRILLIEDDPAIAEMYRLQLDLDGHTVWVAADGESGLDMARTHRPDIVLLDVRLPRLDGFEVLAALRDHPDTNHLPVVFLSNYGAADMVRRGLEMGATDYLVKSQVTPVDLSTRLSAWTR